MHCTKRPSTCAGRTTLSCASSCIACATVQVCLPPCIAAMLSFALTVLPFVGAILASFMAAGGGGEGEPASQFASQNEWDFPAPQTHRLGHGDGSERGGKLDMRAAVRTEAELAGSVASSFGSHAVIYGGDAGVRGGRAAVCGGGADVHGDG
eukprot:2295862-Rhodomonas_salina.1